MTEETKTSHEPALYAAGDGRIQGGTPASGATAEDPGEGAPAAMSGAPSFRLPSTPAEFRAMAREDRKRADELAMAGDEAGAWGLREQADIEDRCAHRLEGKAFRIETCATCGERKVPRLEMTRYKSGSGFTVVAGVDFYCGDCAPHGRNLDPTGWARCVGGVLP